MTDLFLKNRCILVTRPAGQAAKQAALIEAAGGEALRFPTLDTKLTRDPTSAALLAALEEFDLVIFVSPTAVESAFALRTTAWPQAVRAAAVGRGTANALEVRGVRDVIIPREGADSEALAALPELQQVEGKRVLIIRGQGGREWLADALRARGARVEYAECYQSTLPLHEPALMDTIRARWQRGLLDGADRKGGIDAISVASRLALDNLLNFLEPDSGMLQGMPLFAGHPRIAAHARARSFGQVIPCEPGDAALMAALRDFFSPA